MHCELQVGPLWYLTGSICLIQMNVRIFFKKVQTPKELKALVTVDSLTNGQTSKQDVKLSLALFPLNWIAARM